MLNSFRSDVRSASRIGLVLMVLWMLLILPAILTQQARAQQAFTPTPTIKIPGLFRPHATLIAPPIIIVKSTPTVVVRDVVVLNLKSILLSNETTKTTADLNFEDQFKATINVQSPSSMLIGESKVITLEIIPELLAQASMVRAELHAINIDSVDDGQPEKTVLINKPVRWNWDIAPKVVGQQEFFLALSYVNDQGSRVHWQNITLQMTVSLPATPTGTATATLVDTQPPTVLSVITQSPTWTASPTNSPEATPIFTLTPTDTYMEKVSDNVAENPAPYLATFVTLLLGLLGVYFQYIRKSGKDKS